MKGGTQITITGTNIGSFASDVQQVLVANVQCTGVTFLGQNGLRCTTQESENDGEGPVVVYTFAGGQSNSNVTFDYVRGGSSFQKGRLPLLEFFFLSFIPLQRLMSRPLVP